MVEDLDVGEWAFVTFHFDQTAMGAGALRERRRADIPRQYVGIAMLINNPLQGLSRDVQRLVPGYGNKGIDTPFRSVASPPFVEIALADTRPGNATISILGGHQGLTDG